MSNPKSYLSNLHRETNESEFLVIYWFNIGTTKPPQLIKKVRLEKINILHKLIIQEVYKKGYRMTC